MRSLLVLAVASMMCCLGSSLAYGQQVKFTLPGRFMMADQYIPSTPLVAANARSLFVLRRGVLAKYNAATRAPEGVVALFGPLDEMPADFMFDDAQAANDFLNERAKRLAPATMTVSDTEVQVLVGDRYFRVDSATLKILTSTTLVSDTIPATTPDSYIMQVNQNAPHPLLTHGDISYRIVLPGWGMPRTPIHFLAFDRTTGKVLATALLPAPLQDPPSFEQVPPDQAFRNINYGNPAISFAAADDSLYVLRFGVLAKFDAKTLALQKTLSLYGDPAVLADIDTATVADKVAVNIDHAKRFLHAQLFQNGHFLNILLGDDFFRVDTADLSVKNKGQVVKTAADDLRDRIDALALHGDTPATALADTLYLVNGKSLLKVDCVSGMVTAKDLPELTARDLNFAADKIADAMAGLKEGDPLMLQGLLLKKTGAGGDTWSVCDATYGELTLTGDKLQDLLGKVDQPELAYVVANGTFKKGAEKGSVDTQYLFKLPVASVKGTLVKEQQDGQDILTLKTTSGVE